ncbi:MAG TPA: BrnT family toxin [Caulobacter sp.]|nr:BrnT family toxin [Caulobacter sp.]
MTGITYDPAKREATLGARGLDFDHALLVFDGPTVDSLDERFDYGEIRRVTVGLLVGRMVIVVWTPRDDARHIISMRKANAREQRRFGHRFEEDR